MMQLGDYHKIVVSEQIVGGIIVLRKGVREYELGRIFVLPKFQNQGIGTQAFCFLWEAYPLAKRWMLSTPAWNQRTHYFYKKVGFVEVGQAGRGEILFERHMAAASHAA
jgi:GNAT superfamily N-acetyltransferase